MVTLKKGGCELCSHLYSFRHYGYIKEIIEVVIVHF